MKKSYYREFTCCVCGGIGIDRGSRQDAKYCSNRCRKRGTKLEKRLENPCKYNEGVACLIQQCDGCGWNPEVQKVRKDKIMEV